MNKKFTKNMISWQCTIVKFRNGKLGLAINDKISENDNDGDEAFIVYDKYSKKFIGIQRLDCYDDNLKNNLSEKGIYRKINAVVNNTSEEVILSDSEWDVIGVNVYPYALDAFKTITSDDDILWLYHIN